MNLNGFRTLRISEGRCQLEYCLKKSHPESPWMVFFHGFGQDSRAFDDLFAIYSDSHNLLSVHIFYHGESWVEGKNPLRQEEWIACLARLFEKEEMAVSDFWAYSMGAKFALVAALALPERIGNLFLLAPDGMVMNPWYRFAAQTFLGRILLKLAANWMPALRPIFWLFSKIGLVKPPLARFALLQMATKDQRKQVLRVWLMFRLIWPDANRFRDLVAEKKLKVRLILGKHDSIIKPSSFKKFKNQIPLLEWVVLDCGHSSLIEKLAKLLKKERPKEGGMETLK